MHSRIVLLVLLIGLTACNVSTLSVKKVEISQPIPDGVLYRLPVPKIQITTKQFKTDLYGNSEKPFYAAALIAVPSDSFAYVISQQPGTLTKDEVTVTLGDGGTLDTYNLVSAEQTTEVLKQLGTLALTAGALAARKAEEAEIERPKAYEEDKAILRGYLEIREKVLQRVRTFHQKFIAGKLTDAEIQEYETLLVKLDAVQKLLHPDPDFVTNVQVIEIEILADPNMTFEQYLKTKNGKLSESTQFIAVARRVR